jgi:hypothetical protein
MAPPEIVRTPLDEDCSTESCLREPSYAIAAITVIAILLAIVGLLWYSPEIYPASNPDGLYRVTTDRLVTTLIGFLVIMLGLFVADRVTPGRWMRRILNDTRAIAAIICVIIYVLGYLFTG